MAQDTELLEFPCSFALKVIGKDEAQFPEHVVKIVSPFVAELDESGLTTRPSRGGRYVSVSVRVRLESRERFNALYRALSKDERVAFVL